MGGRGHDGQDRISATGRVYPKCLSLLIGTHCNSGRQTSFEALLRFVVRSEGAYMRFTVARVCFGKQERRGQAEGARGARGPSGGRPPLPSPSSPVASAACR